MLNKRSIYFAVQVSTCIKYKSSRHINNFLPKCCGTKSIKKNFCNQIINQGIGLVEHTVAKNRILTKPFLVILFEFLRQNSKDCMNFRA